MINKNDKASTGSATYLLKTQRKYDLSVKANVIYKIIVNAALITGSNVCDINVERMVEQLCGDQFKVIAALSELLSHGLIFPIGSSKEKGTISCCLWDEEAVSLVKKGVRLGVVIEDQLHVYEWKLNNDALKAFNSQSKGVK